MVSALALATMRLTGAAAVVVVVAFTVRNRDTPGAEPLLLLSCGAMLWMLSEVPLLATESAVLQPFLLKLVFTGVAIVVAGWGLFALDFTGYGGRYAEPATWVLTAGMLLSLVLIWVNPGGLFWQSFMESTDVWGFDYTFGPAHAVYLGYSYLVIGSGVVLLGALIARSQALYREQVYAILGAIIIPWGADFAYQFQLLAVELTPIGIAVSAVLFATAIYRFDLMYIAPVAQETIIENIHDGVLVVDRKGRVVDINQRAATLFDVDPKQAGGETFHDLLDAVPAFGSGYRRLDTTVSDDEGEATATEDGAGGTGVAEENDEDATDAAVQHFEFEHDDRYFRVGVTTLRDHHDRVVAQQFLLHDITEQRRYQELLEEENEQLDQFASVVSHDLRNPLNVAMSSVELVRETGEMAQLDRAAEAHDRMESLIGEMLELARHGQRVTEKECLALEKLAAEAWENVETPAATLDTEESMDLLADHDRLLQLFENLFRNAIDHAGEDVSVTVGVLADDEGFFVADDGPGIPPDEREKVFDSNFTTAEQGTGLGLFIADAIVGAHDWTISITESVDGGARFEIRDVEPCEQSSTGQQPSFEETQGGWADREWVTETDESAAGTDD